MKSEEGGCLGACPIRSVGRILVARRVHGRRRGSLKAAPEVVRGEAADTNMFTAAAMPVAPWGSSPGAITALRPLTPSLTRSQSDDFWPQPLALQWARCPSGYPRGGALGCTLSAPWILGRRPRGGVPSMTGRVATAFPAGSVRRPWEKAPARTLAQVLLPAAGPRPKAPNPFAPPGARSTARTCSLRRRIRPESSMAAVVASAPGREEGGGGGREEGRGKE